MCGPFVIAKIRVRRAGGDNKIIILNAAAIRQKNRVVPCIQVVHLAHQHAYSRRAVQDAA
jgi:hypothetical protein